MSTFTPCYRSLHHTGELAQRAQHARRREASCDLCARECGVDRSERTGACHTGLQAWVASYGPHYGEENPLRGWNGSGTIFFSYCNLRCVFCQNHDISQAQAGRPVTSEELAAMMLSLQDMGCHNINLVSPSHVVAEILDALTLAAEGGLSLPLVYNTGGFDSLAALELLDGVVDIYMPDMKYGNPVTARRLSKVQHYPAANQRAVLEMHRQVGDLQIDETGVARRGLLVRHLVLPHGLAGTREVMEFLASEVSRDTYVNVMAQYRPAFRAADYPEVNRPLLPQEYHEAIEIARRAGLHRFDRR